MSAQHTPGPWRDKALIANWIGDAQGRVIADVARGSAVSWREGRTGGDIGDAEADANARLIAAAPDLLHFAEWAIQICDGPMPLNVVDAVRAVASRARELVAQAVAP